ncbi:MAG: endonuclease domain-containing protein [Actinomycetota bacterium]
MLRCFRRGGLPRPLLQYPIRDADGLIGIADFAFLEHRLAVEADGYKYHSDRIPWDRDRARRNRLTLLGWRIVHITWREFEKDPARCAEMVRRALAD